MSTKPVMAALPEKSPTSKLSIALWVVQFVLAAVFAMAGLPKVSASMAEVAQKFPPMAQFPEPLIRFIGISELAGALGLVFPAITRVMPGLVPLAGAGLALVMLLAMGFHASRGEFQALPTNIVLGGLALFVWWGRSRKAPLPSRP